MFSCCFGPSVVTHQSVTEAVDAVSTLPDNQTGRLSFRQGHPVFVATRDRRVSNRVASKVDEWLQSNRLLFLDCTDSHDLARLHQLLTRLQAVDFLSAECQDRLAELESKTLRAWKQSSPWEHGLVGVQASGARVSHVNTDEITILYSAQQKPLTCPGGLLDPYPHAATVFASLPKAVAKAVISVLNQDKEPVWLSPTEVQLLAYALEGLEAYAHAEAIWRKAFAELSCEKLFQRYEVEQSDQMRLWILQALALRASEDAFAEQAGLARLDAAALRTLCLYADPDFAVRWPLIEAWLASHDAAEWGAVKLSQYMDLRQLSLEWLQEHCAQGCEFEGLLPKAQLRAWSRYLRKASPAGCPQSRRELGRLDLKNPAPSSAPREAVRLA